jgi:hypothetical protein
MAWYSLADKGTGCSLTVRYDSFVHLSSSA